MLRLDNVTHEDGVAAIGDDAKEEWMVDMQTWWATVQDVFTASCSGSLGPFFVNLKERKRRCLQRIQSPHGYHWFLMCDEL